MSEARENRNQREDLSVGFFWNTTFSMGKTRMSVNHERWRRLRAAKDREGKPSGILGLTVVGRLATDDATGSEESDS